MRKAAATLALPVLAGSLLASGCSINRLAVRAVSGFFAGSGGGTAFTGDDDPQLVADALPFALKLYESLLEADPQNPALALATGRSFVTYAYAFVQIPADELGDMQVERQAEMRERAKKLFLRGRRYILDGMELRRPGFRAALDSGKVDQALRLAGKQDADYLYWLGAAWLSAFSVSPFDMELLVTIPIPLALLRQVNEWDERWGEGAVHGILISFYGSAPADLGGSPPKAREEFARAVEISGGRQAGPYIALATSVCVREQNAKEFRELLGKALAIDVDKDPANRLQNIILQNQARWLLDHIDNYFLVTEGGAG